MLSSAGGALTGEWRGDGLTGLTLAFATDAQELPIIISLVLGLGAYRLSAAPRPGPAAAGETLGTVTVLATDKTGMTENRMAVARTVPGRVCDDELIALGAACTPRPAQAGRRLVGDPTDVAFLVAARERGLTVPGTGAALRVRPGRETMTVVLDGGFVSSARRRIAHMNTVITTGSPESCSPAAGETGRCRPGRADGEQGLRVIAVATAGVRDPGRRRRRRARPGPRPGASSGALRPAAPGPPRPSPPRTGPGSGGDGDRRPPACARRSPPGSGSATAPC
ncbi:cation-transporting P-type ATPase [Pseudonocardia sp. MCCB 268]|nr:cation-transporting P-type ATPase [Pseudonocardia cytotoxica]